MKHSAIVITFFVGAGVMSGALTPIIALLTALSGASFMALKWLVESGK